MEDSDEMPESDNDDDEEESDEEKASNAVVLVSAQMLEKNPTFRELLDRFEFPHTDLDGKAISDDLLSRCISPAAFENDDTRSCSRAVSICSILVHRAISCATPASQIERN